VDQSGQQISTRPVTTKEIHFVRSRRALPGIACALCLVAPLVAAAQTTDQLKREVAAIGAVERLGEAIPRGATFTDSEGRAVGLAGLGDRPVLLSFNYTACPRLCGLQLHGVARLLKDVGYDGQAFALATVSIDPDEKVDQLVLLKRTLVGESGNAPGAAESWRFLRGSKADVDALADAVGFKYRYDPATGEFAHQATLVVLTADGRVSGYLHGITYKPEALRAALDRARQGAVATAAEQRSLGGFLLTCMGFDPADRTPLALKVMRAGGIAAMTFLLSFLGYQVLRDLRRRRRENPAA
jgi:protein SCO1